MVEKNLLISQTKRDMKKEIMTTPNGLPPFPSGVKEIKYKCCDAYFLGDEVDTFKCGGGYYHIRKHLTKINLCPKK